MKMGVGPGQSQLPPTRAILAAQSAGCLTSSLLLPVQFKWPRRSGRGLRPKRRRRQSRQWWWLRRREETRRKAVHTQNLVLVVSRWTVLCIDELW